MRGDGVLPDLVGLEGLSAGERGQAVEGKARAAEVMGPEGAAMGAAEEEKGKAAAVCCSLVHCRTDDCPQGVLRQHAHIDVTHALQVVAGVFCDLGENGVGENWGQFS